MLLLYIGIVRQVLNRAIMVLHMEKLLASILSPML